MQRYVSIGYMARVDMMLTCAGAPQGSPSRKRRRGKVVSYAPPLPIISSGEDIKSEEEKIKSPKV